MLHKNDFQFEGKIHAKIVNKTDNMLYLKDKYYTPILDLAIVYYIPVGDTYKYFATYNENLFKQMLKKIRTESKFCLTKDSELYLVDENGKNISIVAILDKQLLDSIQKELKTPFYLFPQSKYDLRIIPAGEILQIEKLENLKKELIASNDDLPADYIVSNHIYYYNNELSVAI